MNKTSFEFHVFSRYFVAPSVSWITHTKIVALSMTDKDLEGSGCLPIVVLSQNFLARPE
jgi:hypothetical protein